VERENEDGGKQRDRKAVERGTITRVQRKTSMKGELEKERSG